MLNRVPLLPLYLNVLAVATCGLIYELLAGTLASYLLGDSVTQFSLIIGVYLSAMGVGAWLSSYVDERAARVFIEVELALALVGGLATPMLFLAFPMIGWFRVLLFGSVVLIGILVGLELPLLMRILKDHLDFNELVSRVLAFDYLGALFASVLFPIFLVPSLGLNRTSLLFGLLNAAVAWWGTALLRPLLSDRAVAALRFRAIMVVVILSVMMIKAATLTTLAEENTLAGRIVYADRSPYQRIVVTRDPRGFQLYLSGHLQFSSVDEYRYHEALVHPAAAVCVSPLSDILILGGGDGLAARQWLGYPTTRSVTLVDLDPAMTRLASDFEPLVELNADAMSDPRMTIIHRDAFVWIGQSTETYDAVTIDFPDPSNYSIGKLYTSRFYAMLRDRLRPGAVVSIQCTSPIVAPASYGCVLETLRTSGFDVLPYHATVPTFGIWGFALAKVVDPSGASFVIPQRLAAGHPPLRYLSDDVLPELFSQPPDLTPILGPVNRLNDQTLVRLYEQEWSR